MTCQNFYFKVLKNYEVCQRVVDKVQKYVHKISTLNSTSPKGYKINES